MWNKIKEFFDIKPQWYYENEIRHIMFKCMQREIEHNKILWDIENHNKKCVIGVGSLLKN